MGDEEPLKIDVNELKNIEPEYTPFNPELDEKYPLTKMFKQDIIEECAEGIPDMSWISQFRNSPASNAEAEILMGQFITIASRAGQWVDIPPRPDEEQSPKYEFGDFSVSIEGMRLEFKRGKEILTELGFIKKIQDDDGKEMMKPQEPMLQFFKERLARYAPK